MITSAFLSIGAFAVLAVVHGLLRPRPGCGAHCDVCTHKCETGNADDHHAS